jgi:predicted alpha/beta-fold hydrolase
MKAIKITTSDGLGLHGVTLGQINGSTCYIFIHGLTSSLWSHLEIAQKLADSGESSAVLFNNRGYGVMNSIKSVDPATGAKSRLLLGATFERFEDSYYDIQAAVNMAMQCGASKIVLVGYSTGCNKILYYLNHKETNTDLISKVVLVSPMSDYLFAAHISSKDTINNLLMNNIEGELIYFMEAYWSRQRFESLFTRESNEQMFRYDDMESNYELFSNNNVKTLIIIGSDDETADREISVIQKWFDKNKKSLDEVIVVNGGNHSLKGIENEIVEFAKS